MQSELKKAARDFMFLFIVDGGDRGISLDDIDPMEFSQKFAALEAALSTGKMQEICSVSFADRKAATVFLRDFTKSEGGLATVDWYALRDRIADKISMTRVEERGLCRTPLSAPAKTPSEDTRNKARSAVVSAYNSLDCVTIPFSFLYAFADAAVDAVSTDAEPVTGRNDEAGYVEFLNEDVPYIVRDIDGRCAILVDLHTRKYIGYRVYEPDSDFGSHASKAGPVAFAVKHDLENGGGAFCSERNGVVQDHLGHWQNADVALYAEPVKTASAVAVKGKLIADLREMAESITYAEEPSRVMREAVDALSAQVQDVADLETRMKAAGMYSIAEMMGVTPLTKWKSNPAINTIEAFADWLDRKTSEYLAMKAGYDLGDKSEDDELFEWVLAHAGVFSTIRDQFRIVTASPASKHGDAE